MMVKNELADLQKATSPRKQQQESQQETPKQNDQSLRKNEKANEGNEQNKNAPDAESSESTGQIEKQKQSQASAPLVSATKAHVDGRDVKTEATSGSASSHIEKTEKHLRSSSGSALSTSSQGSSASGAKSSTSARRSGLKRSRPSSCTSKFRGVSWFKANHVWKAQITVNGKYEYLGYFEKETDAAWAYDIRALQVHGTWAQLNFPDKIDQLREDTQNDWIAKHKESQGLKRSRKRSAGAAAAAAAAATSLSSSSSSSSKPSSSSASSSSSSSPNTRPIQLGLPIGQGLNLSPILSAAQERQNSPASLSVSSASSLAQHRGLLASQPLSTASSSGTITPTHSSPAALLAALSPNGLTSAPMGSQTPLMQGTMPGLQGLAGLHELLAQSRSASQTQEAQSMQGEMLQLQQQQQRLPPGLWSSASSPASALAGVAANAANNADRAALEGIIATHVLDMRRRMTLQRIRYLKLEAQVVANCVPVDPALVARYLDTRIALAPSQEVDLLGNILTDFLDTYQNAAARVTLLDRVRGMVSALVRQLGIDTAIIQARAGVSMQHFIQLMPETSELDTATLETNTELLTALKQLIIFLVASLQSAQLGQVADVLWNAAADAGLVVSANTAT
ncbi:AP2-like ethylene-responsive transcription factor TOE3 [Hondaea fermentalgiana]|uniref:AP2-like ethylene-responsive transcription factor TOE3 n=1 Tax=Hondaea fermentalgiana TaxID=2315210 RepID=A0A2R5G8Z4_9STRA|nr:AP2-like ethylene-responsive transcription factor TOE3 [Hondaea fermentalgiana]|eukprot:GBG27536.1 AP2-like ethylene-responsive transcription factor TOE3 [Hondaea fermentalgiana]